MPSSQFDRRFGATVVQVANWVGLGTNLKNVPLFTKALRDPRGFGLCRIVPQVRLKKPKTPFVNAGWPQEPRLGQFSCSNPTHCRPSGVKPLGPGTVLEISQGAGRGAAGDPLCCYELGSIPAAARPSLIAASDATTKAASTSRPERLRSSPIARAVGRDTTDEWIIALI
jgi:hypothetical protein